MVCWNIRLFFIFDDKLITKDSGENLQRFNIFTVSVSKYTLKVIADITTVISKEIPTLRLTNCNLSASQENPQNHNYTQITSKLQASNLSLKHTNSMLWVITMYTTIKIGNCTGIFYKFYLLVYYCFYHRY